MKMTFKELLVRSRGSENQAPHRLLCLDPGHDTGWALFVDGELTEWGQEHTVVDRHGHNEGTVDWRAMEHIFNITTPTTVVFENYRVYSSKSDRHINSEVLTVRIIGGIDYLCWKYNTPVYNQMAFQHKGFCTDKKLKMWGYWQEGMRHSRDAIRIGCFWLLFNKEDVEC